MTHATKVYENRCTILAPDEILLVQAPCRFPGCNIFVLFMCLCTSKVLKQTRGAASVPFITRFVFFFFVWFLRPGSLAETYQRHMRGFCASYMWTYPWNTKCDKSSSLIPPTLAHSHPALPGCHNSWFATNSHHSDHSFGIYAIGDRWVFSGNGWKGPEHRRDCRYHHLCRVLL